MFPLTLSCLVLLVGSLTGGLTTTAAAASATTVSENPFCVAESVFDYSMVCPLVFGAVPFVAFVLLGFVPARLRFHEKLSTASSPITVATASIIVCASLVGKNVVTEWSSWRAIRSRGYMHDDAQGVARIAADQAVPAFRSTSVHHLYRWISPHKTGSTFWNATCEC